jgi:hypothetical protein
MHHSLSHDFETLGHVTWEPVQHLPRVVVRHECIPQPHDSRVVVDDHTLKSTSLVRDPKLSQPTAPTHPTRSRTTLTYPPTHPPTAPARHTPLHSNELWRFLLDVKHRLSYLQLRRSIPRQHSADTLHHVSGTQHLPTSHSASHQPHQQHSLLHSFVQPCTSDIPPIQDHQRSWPTQETE